MPPREPQVTPPKTFAINSSRDMLEKLKREIERLAGSIIRQEVVDHGLNAAERFKISPDPIGRMAALSCMSSRQPARALAIRHRPLSCGLPMEAH